VKDITIHPSFCPEGEKMITVRQLLDEKGNQVWAVEPDDAVLVALKTMSAQDIGAVLVLDAGVLVGIFSERDYARKVVQTEKANLDMAVKEFMTQLVYYVRPDQTLDECMALMTSKHIRHLPVLAQGKLIGVISIGDVVKEIISDKESMIRGLENYITGRDYVIS